MKIPKVIVQTFSSRDKLTPEMAKAIESWREKNPDWEYKLFDNNECVEFIGKHFDKDTLEAFDNLIPGAFKGDLFRYCYLYINGGVYTDIDNICLIPLNEFLNEDDSFVLVKDSVNHKANLIYNAFMATEKNNPVIKEAIDISVHNVKHNIYPKTQNKIVDVLSVTGPRCLGIALEKHINDVDLRLFNVIEQQAKVGERFLVEIIGIVTDNDETVVKVKYDGYKETDDYWDLFDKRTIYKNETPLISCLCPTQSEPSILKDAIECFNKQTYPNKELILVTDEKNPHMEYLKSVVCENIKLVHAPHKTPIGALRNISVDNASGKYVATWDDDDIHHAERLRLQYEATIRHKKDGCLLLNALFHNMNNGDKGIMKDWYGSEASLFIIKSSLKRYDDELTVSEDTPIVRPLLKENKLTILAKPQLYIYRFHKTNNFLHTEHLYRAVDTII